MNESLERIVFNPSELLKKYDPENKLNEYYQLLVDENKRVNLVSRDTLRPKSGADEDVCRPRETGIARSIGTNKSAGDSQRHSVSRETGVACFINLKKLAAQSLLPFERFELNGIKNYLDIGSGGGFPAIPILLTQQVEQATLVERIKKKAGALRRILLALDLKADIISQSFEDLTFEPLFDLITLRQVKLTLRLFEKIHAVMRSGGVFIYYNATDIVPQESSIQKLTYAYTTSYDDSGGKFTIFRKRS